MSLGPLKRMASAKGADEKEIVFSLFRPGFFEMLKPFFFETFPVFFLFSGVFSGFLRFSFFSLSLLVRLAVLREEDRLDDGFFLVSGSCGQS